MQLGLLKTSIFSKQKLVFSVGIPIIIIKASGMYEDDKRNTIWEDYSSYTISCRL